MNRWLCTVGFSFSYVDQKYTNTSPLHASVLFHLLFPSFRKWKNPLSFELFAVVKKEASFIDACF